MATENSEQLESLPLNALPFVYFKDLRMMYRTLRKMQQVGVFADMDTLRAATALDGQGPMPEGTFREYVFGLAALGWLEVRRTGRGKDEGALTMLGDRVVRSPEIDTLAVMDQWEPILDRLCASVIERELAGINVNELEKRFEIGGVKIPRRRARFFNDFYPIYQAVKAKAADRFLELQATPEHAPRRIQRGRQVKILPNASIVDSGPEPSGERHVVLVQQATPQPAMMIYVAIPLGSRAEYHRDGRLLILPL